MVWVGFCVRVWKCMVTRLWGSASLGNMYLEVYFIWFLFLQFYCIMSTVVLLCCLVPWLWSYTPTLAGALAAIKNQSRNQLHPLTFAFLCISSLLSQFPFSLSPLNISANQRNLLVFLSCLFFCLRSIYLPIFLNTCQSYLIFCCLFLLAYCLATKSINISRHDFHRVWQ